MAEDPTPLTPAGQQPAAQPPQVAMQVDLSKLQTVYCNFFRLSLGGGQEEVLMDVGLHSGIVMSQGQGTAPVMEPIQMSHRLVMNPFVAKRLLESLKYIVGRYEQAFGVLEVDPMKRLRAGVRPQG
jgi:hypothetical protein